MDIKDLRNTSGLSQVKFSEKYGIPVRTIQDWEAGVRTPSEYVTRMLAYIVADEDVNHKAWVFNEYRDKAGIGDYKLFKSKEAALSYAKDCWDHLDRHDKKSYLADPQGMFFVAELPVEWDDVSEKFVPDFAEYDPVWDALEECE